MPLFGQLESDSGENLALFTSVVEVEIKVVAIHVKELWWGFEGKTYPIKKVDRVPIGPKASPKLLA